MVQLFNAVAFFIVLREVLEACLVVGIVLAALRQLGNTHLRKWVWWGAISGIALSLVFGIAFAVIFYTQGNLLFKGKSEKIFEGVVFLIAAGLLTWMIIWMQQMGRNMQRNIERQVEGAIERKDGGKWGIFLMVFVQVLREGIETWIFLFGATSASDNPNAWRAIPIPGILGVIVGIGASYALFRGLVELSIERLFFWSSILLMLFSAGLTSHAFHELQEVDWFGPWDTNQKDWWNARMWSTKACCNDSENQFFAFLRALFGYQDTPTFVEWSTYFAYWLIVIVIILSFNWSKVRGARKTVAGITKKFTFTSLLITFIAFLYTCINPTWHGTLSMTTAFLVTIIATLTVFDATGEKIAAIRRVRKPVVLCCGVVLSVLTVFMVGMHIALMAADEAESLPRFYYVGLIFSEEWASRGRAPDGNSWVSIAVLSWSMMITFFFYGTQAMATILHAGNIDSEGYYNYDDMQRIKDEDQSNENLGNATGTSDEKIGVEEPPRSVEAPFEV